MSVFKKLVLSVVTVMSIVSGTQQLFAAISHADSVSQKPDLAPKEGGSGI
jgi:hypothetical protein